MASVLPAPEEYAALAPRPGSPVWLAFNDARMLGTAAYATLLQVAHPTVGAGVHDYSSFTKDPWGRLLRTLDYVHGTIYGGPELAGSIGKRVREVHRTIRGTTAEGVAYNAMEPGAFAWVHATLALAIFEGRKHFARPMTYAEREAFYAQWLDVGRLIGVRVRDLPTDLDGFDAYCAQALGELRWTPAVPEVLDTLAKTAPPPGLPPAAQAVYRVLRPPLALQAKLALAGVLPPHLRTELGLRYTRADAAAFAVICAATKASAPLMVGPLGTFGPHYVRWRREALARGDVASQIGASKRAAAVA